MADEKRIAALKQAINRGALNDEQKAAAQREIRQRELAMQIRSLEDEKETAVDAAQEKLSAAEEEQKAAVERLAIQEALVAAGQENNNLIKKQISLLSSLAGAMAGIGDSLGAAIGDALGGADTGNIDEMLAGLGSGFDTTAIQTSLEEVMSEIDFETIMADVTAEFAPLEEAAGNLSTTLGDLKTNWTNFLTDLGLIDENGQSTVDWLGTLGDVLWIVAGALFGIKAGGLLIAFATGLGGVATAAGTASGAMGTFSAIVTALGGPVVWIMALLGALAAAWATDFMGMQTTLTSLDAQVNLIFTLLGEKILQWASDTAQAILDWVDDVGQRFTEAGDSATAMTDKMKAKGEEIKTAFLNLQTKIKEELEKIKGYFTDAKTAVGDMQTWFDEQIQKIADKFSNAKDKVSNFLDELKGIWEWIKSHTFDISLPSLPGGGGGNPDGERASGGPVSGGGAYLVGEEGPELFVPNSSGEIIPNGGQGTAVAPAAAKTEVYFTGDIKLGDAGS
jgi:hypothetical protein